MAIDFNGTDQGISRSQLVSSISTASHAMAVICRLHDSNAVTTPLSNGKDAAAFLHNFHLQHLNNANNNWFRAVCGGSSGNTVATTSFKTTTLANEWIMHYGARWRTGNDRKLEVFVYRYSTDTTDSNTKTTSLAAHDPSGMDSFRTAHLDNSGGTQWFNGEIAEAAFWNFTTSGSQPITFAELTQFCKARLSMKAWTPYNTQLASFRSLWKEGYRPDVINGTEGTLVGTPTDAVHPSDVIHHPRRRWSIGHNIGAAAPAGSPFGYRPKLLHNVGA